MGVLKNALRVAAVLVFGSVSAGGAAHAVLAPSYSTLATQSGSVDAGTGVMVQPGVFVGFEVFDSVENQQFTIIEQLITGDQVFSLTSGLAFDAASAALTNGAADNFTFFTRYNLGGQPAGGASQGVSEASFDYTPPLSGNATDLAGAFIQQIVYTISNFQFSQDNGATVSYDYELRIIGTPPPPLETPLPAAMWLMLAGLGGLSLSGRGFRKQAV